MLHGAKDQSVSNDYEHIWSFHWNASLKEPVSHSASSYSHKCLWHCWCACAFCTCWLLPHSPRMHRQGKLIWQDAWSQLASLVQTISLCSKNKKKNLKNKGYTAPFGTLKGERTTLPLRQSWKAAEQHWWRIVVWPSAISIICFCPSLLSCITEIILNYTGVLRLNSKLSKGLGCLE